MNRARSLAIFLAATGTLASILVRILPLTLIGYGRFGNFLAPVQGNTRLTIGVFFFEGGLMLVPLIGLLLLVLRRDGLAAGVLVAAAFANLGIGFSEPFLHLWRARPVIAMILFVGSSALFATSAVVILRRQREEAPAGPLPPPPSPV